MGPLTYIDGEGRRVTEPAEPLFSFSLPIWVQPPPFFSRLWLRALRRPRFTPTDPTDVAVSGGNVFSSTRFGSRMRR